MKKIAVTAATGNIGRRVAQQISLKGAETVLLGQNLERLNHLNVSNSTPTVADISSSEQMIAATKGVIPACSTGSGHKQFGRMVPASYKCWYCSRE